MHVPNPTLTFMGVAWSLAKVGYCGIGLQHEASFARPGDPQVAKRYKITMCALANRLYTRTRPATSNRSVGGRAALRMSPPNLERVYNRPGRDGPRLVLERVGVQSCRRQSSHGSVTDQMPASRTRPLECTMHRYGATNMSASDAKYGR